MKRLLFLTATFAALALLAPQIGQAQPYTNQLGIYSDMVGTPSSANFVAAPNVPFNAYLVLTYPVNDNFQGGTGTNRPVTQVGAFECRVNLPSEAGFIAGAPTFPGGGVNIESSPYLVVGYVTPIPVVNNAAVLATWSMMVTDSEQHDITMGLAHFPSIPGEMAIVDAEDTTGDDLVPVFVSTADFAVPVFSINGTAAVATEESSFGSVKALFR